MAVIFGQLSPRGVLEALISDAFGNYVVQHILAHCSDEQIQLITTRVKVSVRDVSSQPVPASLSSSLLLSSAFSLPCLRPPLDRSYQGAEMIYR